jgi:hypothetical protein
MLVDVGMKQSESLRDSTTILVLEPFEVRTFPAFDDLKTG